MMNKLKWWFDSKLGMFVHFGLYSLLAGEYKGRKAPGISEWIMKRLEIPKDEYLLLASQFNPVNFSAKTWVDTAKKMGAKYITFTAKHHEGFALYHSKVSPYNVVDMTPYGKDIVKELADECAMQGIVLCLYYSHVQDWIEEGAVGNTWDFSGGSFREYLDRKVKPQLSELLTQYGKIGMIWFDTPYDITPEESSELAEYVRSLQEDCLVSTRVGNGFGDFEGYGDNQVPSGTMDGFWESIGTLNNSWGFKTVDDNWKSPEIIIRLFSDIISKGGVYTLNIGPKGDGSIPTQTTDILSQFGDFVAKNGEAFYGCERNPYPFEFPWGGITTKADTIYLHVFEKDGSISLSGLLCDVKKVYALQDQKPLPFVMSEGPFGTKTLTVDFKRDQKEPMYIIAVETDGMKVNKQIMPQDGAITLDAQSGTILGSADAKLSEVKIIENWKTTENRVSWQFYAPKGEVDLTLVTIVERPHDWADELTGKWEGGHRVEVVCENQSAEFDVVEGHIQSNARSLYFKDMYSPGCTITLAEDGIHTIELRAKKIVTELGYGLRLKNLTLKAK